MTKSEARAPVPMQDNPVYASPAFDGLKLGAHNRQAIEAMAHEGIDLHEAAKRYNANYDSLRRVFRRPHVKAAFDQVVKNVCENAAQGAFLRMVHLSKHGSTERIKVDANTWVAGVGGISPVKKVEGHMRHNITFSGFSYDQMGSPGEGVIEGTATPVDTDTQ